MKKSKIINQNQLTLPLTFAQVCPQQQKDAGKANLKKRAQRKLAA
jgi:hypothetical protein